MKTMKHLQTLALVGLAVAGLASSAVAQPTNYVYAFDTSSSDASWIRWWGVAFDKPSWDGTMDASNNPASGSLKAIIPFVGASGEQFCYFGNFNNVGPWDASVTLDGTKYTNVIFDIRVDPSSALTSAGHYGGLNIGLATASWGQLWLNDWNLPVPTYNIPAAAASGWVRATIPIDPTLSGLNTIAGVIFKMWSNGAHTNTLTFWVDNVTVEASEGPPPPPPTLGIEKAESGLQLHASQVGGQWQRQGIRTTANGYSWLSYPFDPVTYSLTIKEFPAPSFGGFQAHIFLAPEAGMPNGPDDSAIDWNTPNIIFVQITQNADGSGSARFMYKTNQPSANSMLWNDNPDNGPVGTLAFLWNPTVRGTWSVTLDATYDTITLTAPNGASTNFAMPPALAAETENLFAGPLDAYFGIQPNAVANVGQSAILSRVQVSCQDPAFTGLDDDFTGPALDTTKWTVVASDAPGVTQVPTDAVWWVSWTLPDTGFQLQGSPTLAPAAWANLTPGTLFRNNAKRKALIPSAGLPGTEAGYFQLVKPE